MSTEPRVSLLRRPPPDNPGETGELSLLPAYTLLPWLAATHFTGRVTFDGQNQYETLEMIDGVPCAEESAEIEARVLRTIGWFSGRYTLHAVAIPRRAASLPLTQTLRSLERLLLRGEPAFETTVRPRSAWRGDFSKTPPWRLFSRLAAEKFSGRLLVERGEQRKLLRWKEGRISSVSSSDARETLVAVLKRWKYLDAGVASQREVVARAEGIRFRDVLRRDGLLPEEKLKEALGTLHVERLLDLFRWTAGTFVVREDLSDALLRLMEERKSASVLVADLEGDPAMLGWAREIVTSWATRNTRAILVTVGFDRRAKIDPSREEDSDRWLSFVEPLDDPGVSWLSLPAETDAWHTADGTRHVRRLVSKLNAGYGRVLWLSTLPPHGSPLLSAAGPLVFVVTKEGTRRRAVEKTLAGLSGNDIAGFIFRERDQKGSTASPIVKSIRSLSALRAVQGALNPLRALFPTKGESATR